MGKGLFITATGTDVGKTYISGLIVKKLRETGYDASYYKAALSGAEVINDTIIPGDSKFVREIASLDTNEKDMVSYIYKSAVSPHLAAKLEGNPVDLHIIKSDYQRWIEEVDYVTVEGSGGIVCPLRYDDEIIMLEDVVKELNLTTIVIADAGLGTINSTVLTVQYLRDRNIQIGGIILNRYHDNDVMERDNKFMIEQLTKVPVLSVVGEGDMKINIDINDLISLYQ